MHKTITKYVKGFATVGGAMRKETLTVRYTHDPQGDTISIALEHGKDRCMLHVPFAPAERMIKESKEVKKA